MTLGQLHIPRLFNLERSLFLTICSVKTLFSSSIMAKSKFEYVREFECHDKCLPNSWIVVRLDGKGFHRFTDAHNFDKPNDRTGLLLMSKAAACVMEEFNDICCAYGQSDEYSFIFSRDTKIYNRRADKILTVVNSLFTSSYVFNWDNFFVHTKLKYPPAFDARIILYPTTKNLRDYLSWRQADVHINNLYNTAFWGLVLKCNFTKQEAQQHLSGTVSSEKHEIMFKKCSINYNNEMELYKKGTVLIKTLLPSQSSSSIYHSLFVPLNCDIIGDTFWNKNPHILDKSVDTPIRTEEVKDCECVFVKFKHVDLTKSKLYQKNKKKEKRNESGAGDGEIKLEATSQDEHKNGDV